MMIDELDFIQGKFDSPRTTPHCLTSAKRPYLAIASAFAEYCSEIEERDEYKELVTKFTREIKREERILLFEALPALRRIIDDGSGSCESDTKVFGTLESSSRAHRLNYSIRKFVSIISSASGPIILLLDDMQVSEFC